jgi:hypothetical protein
MVLAGAQVPVLAPLVDGLRSMAAPDARWDVLTSNSPGRYYDTWALRSSLLGLDYDCWFGGRSIARGLGKCDEARVRVDQGAPAFAVNSSFNGIGLYRMAALHPPANASQCRYHGSRNSLICEHVPFNLCLRSHGLRVGVLPSLVADCGVAPARAPRPPHNKQASEPPWLHSPWTMRHSLIAAHLAHRWNCSVTAPSPSTTRPEEILGQRDDASPKFGVVLQLLSLSVGLL